MSLADAQALMWRAITWPTGIDDFLAQADADTRAAFEATFAQTPGFPRQERLTVYAESYFWRVSGLLHDQLKVTAWILGEVKFHNLVTDFVLQVPSSAPDIRLVGARFLRWLPSQPCATEVPDLVQLTEVDWATVWAIDAEDGPVLDAQALAAIPLEQWPGLRLRPSVGTRLLTTSRDYPAMWRAATEGIPSPPTPLPPEDDPHHVLVWRHGLSVFHRGVTPPEARALAAMIDGCPFSEICVAAAGPGGDEADATVVVQWLRRWLAKGLLGAVETTPLANAPAEPIHSTDAIDPTDPIDSTDPHRQ